MATWINRGKDILTATHPGGTAPSNAEMLTRAKALVNYRVAWWDELLGKLNNLSNGAIANAVRNPDGTDASDIGTVDEDGNYTPFSNADRNKCLALYVAWSYAAKEIRPALKAYKKRDKQLGGDASTETIAEAEARVAAEVDAEATTELGDADSEWTDA